MINSKFRIRTIFNQKSVYKKNNSVDEKAIKFNNRELLQKQWQIDTVPNGKITMAEETIQAFKFQLYLSAESQQIEIAT
jgi:hypothetical protein